jgi:ABC-type antimicrobial peptide transport system permease subunit
VEDFAIPVEIGSGVGAFPVIVGLIVLLIFAYFAYRRFGKAKR